MTTTLCDFLPTPGSPSQLASPWAVRVVLDDGFRKSPFLQVLLRYLTFLFKAIRWFNNGLLTCWVSIFVIYVISSSILVSMYKNIQITLVYWTDRSATVYLKELKAFETSHCKCVTQHSLTPNQYPWTLIDFPEHVPYSLVLAKSKLLRYRWFY